MGREGPIFCSSKGDTTRVYVDDMLTKATTSKLLAKAIGNLGIKLEPKNLRRPTYFLIGVSHDKQTRSLTISQRKYTDLVLRCFKMQYCNPVKTSMESGQGETDTKATIVKLTNEGQEHNE